MDINKNDPVALLRWARSCVPYPSDCHAAIDAYLINPTHQPVGLPVVDVMLGANAITRVPPTHIWQQWGVEQAKACAEAWGLKWK